MKFCDVSVGDYTQPWISLGKDGFLVIFLRDNTIAFTVRVYFVIMRLLHDKKNFYHIQLDETADK